MKPKRILLVAMCAFLACSVSADTLRLKNGQVIQGTFISGDSRQLQFLGPGGQVQAFGLGEVDTLIFAPAPPPAPAAAPATSTAVPAAAKPTPTKVTVPASTLIQVRMVDSIDTSKTKQGQVFAATLETNLVGESVVVAKKGATVHGRVTKSTNARRLSGTSELQMELTDIVIGGTAHPISTGGFQQKGSKEGGATAKKVAGGAGLGAIVGAIAGDAGMGAAIGATSGLAMAMVKKGEPIVVPSETLLEFSLKQPATLPVSR